MVLHSTQVGRPNVQPTARFALTAKKLAILPKSVEAGLLGNMLSLLPQYNTLHIQHSEAFLLPMLNTEAHYAVVGLEMLDVCWAISKCKLFFSGLQHFTVITDHNPLIPILNNHHLDEIENHVSRG